MSSPLRVVVLLSGGGTTLENLCQAVDAGRLPIRIALVVSSRADAFGLERARRRGIQTATVPSRDFGNDWVRMSAAVNELVAPAKPDLVCLAGYLCRYFPDPAWAGKVMNIHPALLPAFGGRGMYGRRVHEAVAAAGVKVTGCTVHFVDDEYDAGPIILQRTCPVFDTDAPDDVAARVFALERLAYPEAIALFAAGRLSLDGRIVRIDPSALPGVHP